MNGGGQKALCALRVTDLPPPPPNHSRRAGSKVPGAEGAAPELHGRCPHRVWPGSPRARGFGSRCRGPAHLAPPPPGSRARGSRSRQGWHTQPPGAPPARAEEPGMSLQLQRGGGLPSCPAHLGLRPSWTSSDLRGVVRDPANLSPAPLRTSSGWDWIAQAQPLQGS